MPRIRDHERESDFGSIFSVSGPGKFNVNIFYHPKSFIKKKCKLNLVVIAENMRGSAMYELVSYFNLVSF